MSQLSGISRKTNCQDCICSHCWQKGEIWVGVSRR